MLELFIFLNFIKIIHGQCYNPGAAQNPVLPSCSQLCDPNLPTNYQNCMTNSQGNSGGCQELCLTPASPGFYVPTCAGEYSLPCPAGTFCTNGATVTPTPCVIGNYCPEGSVTPIACQTGAGASRL